MKKQIKAIGYTLLFSVQSILISAEVEIASELPFELLDTCDNNSRYQDSDGYFWSINNEIPGNPESNYAPNICEYKNNLYMIHKDGDADTIYYQKFNGNIWSQKIKLSFESDDTPSMAVFNGKLFLVHKEAHSDTLYYASFENSWSQSLKIPGDPQSNYTPSLVTFKGKLYMIYKGAHSNKIYYAIFDGTKWSVNKSIPGNPESNYTPALCIYNDKLYMAYKGANSTALYYATFDGSNWSINNYIATADGSNDSPSICHFDNKIFMVYKASINNSLYYLKFNGNSWEHKGYILGGPGSNYAPSLCAFLNSIYMVYKGASSEPLYFANYMQGSPSWMNQIPGNKMISTLTLPGTHDAAAYTKDEPLVKTQRLSFREQLNAGCRFLDVRARLKDNEFALHHGIVYLDQGFGCLLQVCKDFLAANPSECILMSLKKEHTSEGSTLSFEQVFYNYYAQCPSIWHLGTTIPTMDEVRGKIVLMRRFDLDSGSAPLGIDAKFGDNQTFTYQFSNNPVQTLYCEDQYAPDSVNEKIASVESHLDLARANSGNPNDLFMTFTSGFILAQRTPQGMAQELNPWLLNTPAQIKGIIPVDFVSANLAKCILKNNFGYTILCSNGGVHSFGLADYYGHGVGSDSQAVSIAMSPTGNGYWILSPNGGIHCFGDAPYKGHGIAAGQTAADIAGTPSGQGYWILCSDGGIHAKGDAHYYGHGKGADTAAVALSRTPTGNGYWILCSNGGIHAFGDAPYIGHGIGSDTSAVALAATPSGQGYWILCSNGGIHAKGDAQFYGHGIEGETASSIIPTASGKGYFILTTSGSIRPFGDAIFSGQGISGDAGTATAVSLGAVY